MLSCIGRNRGMTALLILCLAAPAWAQSPLSVVPASSPIVVQVRGVGRTKDRVINLLTAAVPDFGPFAGAMLDAGMQNLPDGRKLDGLAKDGPVFVVLSKLPAPGTDPEDMGFAIVAKVTDYDAFRNGILSKEEKDSLKKDGAFEKFSAKDRTCFFQKVGDYAVVTGDKDTAAAFAKNAGGLDAKLPEALAFKFLEADASVYINLQAVAKEYGDQYKAFAEQITGVLESGAVVPGMDKNAVDMTKKILKGFGQFLDDGQALVLTIEARPENLHFGLHASVGKSSKTADALKSFKTAATDELTTLPAGYMSYSAAAITAEALKSLPILFGLPGAGEKGTAALEKLAAAGPQVQLQASGMPVGGIQVWTFQDPAKAAAAQLELYQAMAEGESFNNAPIKGKPTVKANAQSHRGFFFHSVRIQFDLDKMVENLPVPAMQDALKSYMKKMIGDELNVWFGTDGKKYVFLTAKNWDAARQHLETYLDGKKTLAQDKDFQTMREQLPRQTTLLGIVDAGKMFPVMIDAMLTMLKEVPGIPPLPDVTVTPSSKPAYLGFSVSLEGDRFGGEFDVSATAVKEIRKMVEPIVKAIRGAAG